MELKKFLEVLIFVTIITTVISTEDINGNGTISTTDGSIKKSTGAKRKLSDMPKKHNADKLSIIGGIAADPGQFSYVALINFIGLSDSWYCTGTLIYYNYVLTSAYCLLGATDVAVLLGEYDMSAYFPPERSPSRVRMFARQWTFHEDFNILTDTNGIGIIQLPLYTIYNKNISTIPMNLIEVNKYSIGKTAYVAGWGVRSADDEGGPANLLYTGLTIIDTVTCQDDWDGVEYDYHICGASPTNSVYQGICFGDSGAPLVLDKTLIGLGLYFDSDCEVYPSVFTPIKPYYNWIIKKVAEAAVGKFWVVPAEDPTL